METRSRALVDAAALGAHLQSLSHQIIAAAIEVHRELGPGFLEAVHEEAMCVELSGMGLTYTRQVPVNIRYKGHPVGQARVDLLVERAVVVELKAVESLVPLFTAQALSYLRALNLRLGLLINFNVPLLKDGIKRVVL